MRVVAAMSGGVDSAVAAARAHEAGHDVTGVHLALSRNPASYRSGARGCCTIEDANDARRAADVIGIPFYVWDLSDRFHEDVVEDFMTEYAEGRTPNPCLRCNEKIKFAAVLDRALGLGFDAVATGHYARLRTGPDGLQELHRAVDGGKDQSYVLGVLTQDQLKHSLFPLGDTPKPQVRDEAARRGLLVAAKPDSHDICFVADGDNAGWLAEKLIGRAPGAAGHWGGAIVDETGAELGRHEGTFGFTIGQRRGLRLGRPAPDGKPRYVLDIEPVSGTVTVGPHERLAVDSISGIRPRWCGATPDVLDGPDVSVQLRAHGAEHRAVVRVLPPTSSDVVAGAATSHDVRDGPSATSSDVVAGAATSHDVRDGPSATSSDVVAGAATSHDVRVEIELLEPAYGIAPGQAAVIFEGTRVVGSATIASTARAGGESPGASRTESARRASYRV